MSIRIGIYGYGNLGRGVELAIRQNPDMEAVGVFTRRDPASVWKDTVGQLGSGRSPVQWPRGYLFLLLGRLHWLLQSSGLSKRENRPCNPSACNHLRLPDKSTRPF